MHAGLVATPVATEESSEEAVAAISQTLQLVVSLFYSALWHSCQLSASPRPSSEHAIMLTATFS